MAKLSYIDITVTENHNIMHIVVSNYNIKIKKYIS